MPTVWSMSVQRRLQLAVAILLGVGAAVCSAQQCEAGTGDINLFQTQNLLADMGIFMPQSVIKITYGDIEVTTGMEMLPSQIQNPPRLSWPVEYGAYYTLVFIDLDSPSIEEPTNREWMHWMVGNIPGCDVSRGEQLTEFFPSLPEPDSGLHRYTYVLYQQNGFEDFSSWSHVGYDLDSVDYRSKKRSFDIAVRYGMSGPVAGNFFWSQVDDFARDFYTRWFAGTATLSPPVYPSY